jgi:hypothetical protein
MTVTTNMLAIPPTHAAMNTATTLDHFVGSKAIKRHVMYRHERAMYNSGMIQIHFPDSDTEAEALGFLAGRYSFRSFEDGTTLVPESALGHLAAHGIRFTVGGKAAYEQFVPTIRDSTTPQIQ